MHGLAGIVLTLLGTASADVGVEPFSRVQQPAREQSLLAGCGGDGDCLFGSSCRDGVCVPTDCALDRDCLPGQSCESGICMTAGCNVDDDCRGGSICNGGACAATGCDVDEDCAEGSSCDRGFCRWVEAVEARQLLR